MGCKGFATRCLRDAWGVYKDCEGFGRIGGHVAGLMESLGVGREGGGGGGGGEERGTEVVDMHEEGGQGEEGITVEFA